MTGPAHGAPVLASVPLGDLLTGIVGALGAVLACYHRDVNGGEGQHVDVSMFEPVLQLLASAAVGWQPGTPAPMRSGSRVSGGSVRNVYRTGDEQWVVVSATTSPQLARLLALMTGAATTPDAAPDASPGADADPGELDRAVAAWVGAHIRDELLAALDGARIPAAPVNDLASIWDDPHVRARHSLTSLPGAEGDPLVFVSPAPRLGATPGAVTAPGPALGAHTVEVYGEWLGLDDVELAGLRARHVI